MLLICFTLCIMSPKCPSLCRSIQQCSYVNISKQKLFFFFTFLRFRTITWCFFLWSFFCVFFIYSFVFLDLSFCSLTTSGNKLHLTFCEQLTHTVWCCTKALCIIFVLLSSRLPLLSSEVCIVSDHVVLTLHVQLPWISFLYRVKTETWTNSGLTRLWPVSNRPGFKVTVAISSLHRENAQAQCW